MDATIADRPVPARDGTAVSEERGEPVPVRRLVRRPWARRLVTVGLVLSASAPPLVPMGAASTIPPPPRISVEAMLPSWRSRVAWAIERFATVGLPLPSMAVTVHRHTRRCDGNGGIYRPGPPPRVDICSVGDADTAGARLIVLHELAHAWAEHHLDAARRDRFLALRGLDAWVDADRPPSEWGAEHAAEVVSWGLMDAEVSLVRIGDAGPDALRDAFELLAGRDPLWADT